MIKSGKKDCYLNMFTDHLLHGSNKLYVYIALLFSAMLKHGYSPTEMLGGTMIPLPKVKGTNNSEKFRAITLCSTMC